MDCIVRGFASPAVPHRVQFRIVCVVGCPARPGGGAALPRGTAPSGTPKEERDGTRRRRGWSNLRGLRGPAGRPGGGARARLKVGAPPAVNWRDDPASGDAPAVLPEGARMTPDDPTTPADDRPPAGSDPLDALWRAARYLLSHPNRARDLDRITACAVEATGTRAAVLFVFDERRGELAVRAASGLEPLAGRGAFLAQARQAVEWAARTKEGVRVDDAATDPRFHVEGAPAGGLLAVPLRFFDDLAAGLVVSFAPARAPEAVAEKWLDLLAAEAALLVQNSRVFDEWRDTRDRLAEIEALRVQNEHLIALGESASLMAREVRGPIETIGAVVRRLGRAIPAGDLQREYVEIILAELERLDRGVRDQLERSEAVRPRLKMEDLNRLVEDVLLLAKDDIVKSRARLIKRLATGLPPLRLDADRIHQVVGSMLATALEGVPAGGRLKLETKRMGDVVQLVVAADGARRPGAALDNLFTPFAAGPGAPGTIGLAAAHQIVKEHGGEIGVRAGEDWPTLFSVNLPIRQNEDRRRTGEDRRRTRRDRRREGRGDMAA